MNTVLKSYLKILTILLLFVPLGIYSNKVCAQESIVGRWPYGECNTVDISDDYAFVGNGSAVTILDITTISSPEKAGELILNSLVNHIKYHNNRLYVSTNHGLYVADISSISEPEVLFEAYTNVQINSVDIQDTLVAVSTNYSLALFSISNPVTFNLLTEITTYPDFAVLNNDILITADYEGLKVFDISNLDTISLVSSVDTLSQAVELAINNDYVYLAEGKGLRIYNISNPESVTQENLISIDGFPCRGLMIDSTGNQLFCATYNKTTLFDVTVPQTPVFISEFIQGGTKNFAFKNNHAFIATSGSGMQIADYSTPASPVPGYLFEGVGPIEDIAVVGNTMYAGYSDTEIIDITDIENPVSVNRMPQQSDKFITRENEIFFLRYNGFIGFDISDTFNPVEIISYADASAGGFSDMIIEDSLIYALNDNHVLDIISISDYGSPVKIGSLNKSENSNKLVKHGNILYTTDAYYTLRIVDVSEPALPVQLDSILFNGSMKDLELNDSILYVTSGTSVYVLDIINPQYPVIYDTLDIYLSNARDIEREGKYLLSTDWSNHLRYANVEPPVDIEEFRELVYGYTSSMEITENFIFLGHYYQGITILHKDSLLIHHTDTTSSEGGEEEEEEEEEQEEEEEEEENGDDEITGISAHSAQNISTLQFSISPNPSEGILFIRINNENFKFRTGLSLCIYDLSGRQVESIILETVNTQSLNLSHLQKGQYIYRLITSNHVQTGKIMIK